LGGKADELLVGGVGLGGGLLAERGNRSYSDTANSGEKTVHLNTLPS
jgi:hypothetical protein